MCRAKESLKLLGRAYKTKIFSQKFCASCFHKTSRGNNPNIWKCLSVTLNNLENKNKRKNHCYLFPSQWLNKICYANIRESLGTTWNIFMQQSQNTSLKLWQWLNLVLLWGFNNPVLKYITIREIPGMAQSKNRNKQSFKIGSKLKTTAIIKKYLNKQFKFNLNNTLEEESISRR